MIVNFAEIKTKSNLLSLVRLFLVIPILIYASNIEKYRILLLSIMAFGIITDILDGYLARKFNEVTEFGKIIDPLADKVCIIAFVIQLFLTGTIPLYYFLIIVLRDVIIFTGGILVSKKINKVLPSNMLGKITVLSIGFYLIAIVAGLDKQTFWYYLLLYLSILLSFVSVIGYGIRGYEAVKWMEKNETV